MSGGPPPGVPAPAGRAEALTGLRFFAAAAIVFWHSQADYLFGWGAFSPFVLAGAVALFFVLSGYVLALNAGKYRSWPNFWVARFARIWPAHVASIALWAALFYPDSLGMMLSPDGRRDLAVNLALLQAWSTQMPTFWSYNSPSWSVSVELFFYAMFPLCLASLRWRPVAVLTGLFVLAWVFIYGAAAAVPSLTPLWLGYINPVVNLPLFGLGIAAGLLQLRLPAPRVPFGAATCVQVAAVAVTVAGNAVMAVPVAALIPAASVWVNEAGACWCYVILIFVLGRYDGAVSRVLSHRWLVYLGEVSYALYLVHQLLLRWHSLHYRAFQLNIWLQYACVWAASLGVAIAMHHVVERPAQRAIKAGWQRLGSVFRRDRAVFSKH